MKCLPSLSWTLLMTSSMWFTPSLVRNFSDISSISISWLNLTVLWLLLMAMVPIVWFLCDLQIQPSTKASIRKNNIITTFQTEEMFDKKLVDVYCLLCLLVVVRCRKMTRLVTMLHTPPQRGPYWQLV